jgi:two-component system phosphate regulon sensor histidine kinase PhoR
MNTKKYRWILYLITLTVITTIAVQVYWNYQNYLQNKQRVANEIQLSLDNAIEEYFADVTKKSTVAFVDMSGDSVLSKDRARSFLSKVKFETLFNNAKRRSLKTKKQFNFGDVKPTSIDGISIFKGRKADSIGNLNTFANKIIISISQDSIVYTKIDSLLRKQLTNKNIVLDYHFNHYNGDSIIFKSDENATFNRGDKKDFVKGEDVFINWKGLNSKSTYLKNNEQFRILFKDSSFEALKRSSTGILLSLLLSLAIISCLFYLLKIINKQKELAEIKNDLISNITHEFKTPITTVSTALEAINNFNAIDDKEKTKKYLSISSLQLKKLHQMVEKLLETATLDSEKLLLQKEEVDVIKLVKNIASKNELYSEEKNIHFVSSQDELLISLDPFHFENAISNLLDNAIKYGGNEIEIHINNVLDTLEITVADNGNGIEKNQQEKIFDKFYRIPKGNTHNVKGFGIGLFYTKKIVEKHDGKIQLLPDSTNTIFKITLPI